ncbi:MAG: hypothetical protein KDA89_22375 [Planctomycetaceae bacterium]|nr:hypothetical protein [Planctomycetaceae bacterium]
MTTPENFWSFLGFDPIGEQAVVHDWKGKVRIFNPSDWSQVKMLPVTLSTTSAMESQRSGTVSPDGKLLAISAGGDEPERIYDLTTGSLVEEPPEKEIAANHIKWPRLSDTSTTRLDGGSMRISFDSYGAVTISKRNPGAKTPHSGVATLRGHSSPGESIAVDEARSEIVTAHRDGTVCRWDLQHPVEFQLVEWSETPVVISRDGATFYMGHKGKPIQLVEISTTTGQIQGMLGGRPATHVHGSFVTQQAFSPDGRYLAVGTDSQWGYSRWLMYDLWTGLARHTENDAEIGDVKCIDWSPDGKWIAAGGRTYQDHDGLFRLYNAGTCRPLEKLDAGAGGVNAVLFSHDSRRLVTAAEDGTIRIWEVPAGKLILTIGRPGDPAVTCAVHSPDGRVLVSGSADGAVTAWNPLNGEQVFRTQFHGAAVQCLAFTPDGRRLMTSSADRSLKVLDPADWRELMTLHLEKPTQSMSFSPDGQRLALVARSLQVLDTEPEFKRAKLRRQRRNRNDEADAVLQSVLSDTTDPIEVRTRIVEKTVADQIQRETVLESFRKWLGQRWFAAYQYEIDNTRRRQVLRQQLVLRSGVAPSDAQTQHLIAGMDAMQRQAWDDIMFIFGGKVEENVAISTVAKEGGSYKLDTMQFVWEIVSNPERSQDDQLLAHFGMQPVVRENPDDATGLTAMAWADYRLGLYVEALDSAELVIEESQDAALSARCLAVIAMAQHQMGQTDVSAQTLLKLDEALQQLPEDSDQTTLALAAEAQTVLALPPASAWKEQAARDAVRIRAKNTLDKTRSAIFLASLAARQSRRFMKQGDLKAAAVEYQTARSLLESQLTLAPSDEDVIPNLHEAARTLADLLLPEGESKLWNVLKPLEMKSQGGATLTLLDDGSVLASGRNPDQDAYEITVNTPLQRISAIRLELLPHASLPQNGPGRFRTNGNFHLNEFRVLINGKPHTPEAVAFSYAQHDNSRGIINGTIDRDNWSIHPRSGQRHIAVFKTDLELATDDTLKLELVSSRSRYPQHNLGRFRLSVSDDPNAYLSASMPDDPFEQLAVAYYFLGEKDALDRLLQGHPTAAVCIGDLYAAVENWERAVAEYSIAITPETTDETTLRKRAEAYVELGQWELAKSDWLEAIALNPDLANAAFTQFRDAEHWDGAYAFGRKLVDSSPTRSDRWLQVSSVAALVGDEPYRDFCRRCAKQFDGTTNASVAERVIKVCLIRPGVIDPETLPREPLAKALEEKTLPEGVQPWGWSALALLACRRGDAEAALNYVEKSESLRHRRVTHLLNLAVLVLAEHQLEHTEKAQQAFEEMSRLFTQERDTTRDLNHDLLIAEILLQECREMLDQPAKGTAPTN